MTLLISHCDILGARSALDAKREKERQEELLREQTSSQRSEEVEEGAGGCSEAGEGGAESIAAGEGERRGGKADPSGKKWNGSHEVPSSYIWQSLTTVDQSVDHGW